MDIEVCEDVGGGYNIGWFYPGEWVIARINVTAAGTYNITARVAAEETVQKSLQLSIDAGDPHTIDFDYSDGSQAWHDLVWSGVELTAGQHDFKFSNASASLWFNVNYFDFALAGGDTTPPGLAEVAAPGVPIKLDQARYAFSSTEPGTIEYGGSCRSITTAAVAGRNDIVFNWLPPGTYSDCTVRVRDAAGNLSDTLNISPFTIDPYNGPARVGGALIGGMKLLMNQ